MKRLTVGCVALVSLCGCWGFDEALAVCLDGGGACAVSGVQAHDGGPFDAGSASSGTVDASTDGGTNAGSDAGTTAGSDGGTVVSDAGSFAALSDVCVPPGHTLCWEAPLSGRLNLLAAAWDGTALWAVGDRRQVVRWANGRFTNWPEFDDPNSALTAVLVASDGGVFAVGSFGATLTWDGHWQANTERVRTDVNFGVAWSDGTTRVIGGSDCASPSSIVLQEDGWESAWVSTKVRANVCSMPLSLAGYATDLWFLASNHVLHRGIDGGWAAFDAGTTDWTAAASVGANNLWFGAKDGTLAHVVDGGWSLVKPAAVGVAAIAPDSDGPLFATDDGALHHLSGSTWASAGSLGFSPTALISDGASRQFGVGVFGGMAARDVNGVRALNAPIDGEVRAIARDTEGDGGVYAVGLLGSAWSRGAQGWRPAVRTADPSQTLTSIAFESPGVARIGALNGTIFALTAGQAQLVSGERVMLSGASLTDDVLALVKLGSRMIAVGDRGFVAFRNSALNQWDTVRAPAVGLPALTDIAVVGSDAVAVGKAGAMVIIHEDAGVEVVNSGVGTDLTGVVGLGQGDYLVTTGLKLRHYLDGGVTETAAFANPQSGSALEVGGLAATSPGDVWAFTSGGDVFHVSGGQTMSWLVREAQGSSTSLNAVLLSGPDVFFGGDSAILRAPH